MQLSGYSCSQYWVAETVLLKPSSSLAGAWFDKHRRDEKREQVVFS